MKRVFIHGAAGTTGLRLAERLQERKDIELLLLPDDRRKDPNACAEAMNASNVVFLCLPDTASREAVAAVTNPDTVVLDTSTAFRTADGWTYGFPELSGRDEVAGAKRIAVPGCHASGFIALTAPLVQAGILPSDAALSCFSLTGYSGGGKKMIAEYEAESRDPLLAAPRQYGLTQQHKHLPEMARYAGLSCKPLFCPIVADFYSGMEVTVPLHKAQLFGASAADVKDALRSFWTGPVVRYAEADDEGGFLSAAAMSGLDSMTVSVQGNDERLLLTARYDNLGKGASGAAVQCMNLVIGAEETAGLKL